jgi:hypothetical protein
MWESLSVIALVAIVAEPILRRIRNRWRRKRMSQAVAALNRGDTVRIRCAARFRNSGGGRRRACLTVGTEGAVISTADGTISKVQLGAPGTNIEIIAELSMITCDVSGRQLEVLLPAGEELLLKAVAASLPDSATERPTAKGGVPRLASG